MRVINKETAFEGKYLRLVRKTTVTDNNQEVIWETVERTNVHNGGVVVIVALTKNGEFILERQWRAPIESFVIQFPAGLTDVENESNEKTAKRELLEETGYAAAKLIPILAVPTNPVLSSVTAWYYFAPEVEYVGNEDRDIGEEIEVLTVTRDSLSKFLLNLPDNTKLDLRVPGIIWVLEEKGLI